MLWREANLKRPKGFGGEKEVSYVVRLRLQESEKKFLEAIARAGEMGSTRSKPSVSAVVVSCVRLAWTCLAEHGQSLYEPTRISQEEAIEAGLRLPGRRKKRPKDPPPPMVNGKPLILYKEDD